MQCLQVLMEIHPYVTELSKVEKGGGNYETLRYDVSVGFKEYLLLTNLAIQLYVLQLFW